MTFYDCYGRPISAEQRARWRRNGTRLRALREAAGVTISGLAKDYGMNACDWKLAELGVRDLDTSQLMEALPIFHMTAAEALVAFEYDPA